MKNISSYIFSIISLLFMHSCVAQTTTSPGSFENIVTREGEAGNFSGTVLVAKGDSIIFIKSIGFADRERQISHDSNTKSGIASTGKLFTRIVTLQLIQEGKLRLEDRITQYLPGFDHAEADQITILHLLEHTSGLGDITVSNKYLRPDVLSSVDRIVELISKEKLDFTPGTKEKYSNSGYSLLGAIASKIDKKTLAAVFNDRIFSRLSMTNSGSAKTGELVEGHAFPYQRKGSKIRRWEVSVPGEYPTGAGSQYSTVMDLFKLYVSIIKDNRLLNDDSKAILFNRFKPGNWQEILHSKKITGYLGGDTRGWSAKLTFMFHDKQPYATIILANFDEMAHPLDLKLREVITSMRGENQ